MCIRNMVFNIRLKDFLKVTSSCVSFKIDNRVKQEDRVHCATMAALTVRDRTLDFFATADRLRPSVHVKRPVTTATSGGPSGAVGGRASANTASLYNDAS